MSSNVMIDRLGDMADVAPDAPADGDVFTWVASTEQWTPAPPAGAPAGDTLTLSGSTTPTITLLDGTNTGLVRFNGGQVEISNNGGGLSISPTSRVGLDMNATQKFGINGNLGFYGLDWKLGNDTDVTWGIQSTSAGGQYSIDVMHRAAAQSDPSLHGFRVIDPALGTIFLHSDGYGNLTVGPPGAVATTATDGFPYIATCAGPPTGTPRAKTGKVPLVWDSTNKKLYIYDGAWYPFNHD
jgi:hypothetical protein